MNKLFCLFFFIILINIIYAESDPNGTLNVFDQSADNNQKTDKQKFPMNKDIKVKFRGELSFALAYMPPVHDGILPSSQFSKPDSSFIDYTDKGDSEKRYHNREGREIGGSMGSIRLGLFTEYSFIIPFIQAKNSLMKNNNLNITLLGNLTPVSWDWGISLTLTPLAFLELQAGFLLGCGWKVTESIAGLGINDNGKIKRMDFGGPHIQLWFMPVFQIDLSYIMPKKLRPWLHIIAIAKPRLEYEALLTVGDDQPWMFQEDRGERLNGWQFLGEFYIGYRFFIITDDTGQDEQFLKRMNNNFIITTAMYVWIEYFNISHYFDSPGTDGWGSDFAYVNFGPAIVFDLPLNLFFQSAFLFCNDKAFTRSTVGNKFYQERVFKDWYLYPRYLAFFVGWRF